MSCTQCLVYWPNELVPHSLRPAGKANARQGDGEVSAFLIGWNPRGTVVCVVDVVEAATADEAEAEVRRIRRCHEDFIPGLRVLGRVHPVDCGAGVLPMRQDDGSKQRRDGVLWVELAYGPALVDLYVCGFRVPAQLFVVSYSPDQRYSTEPAHLSAVSRLGYDGVKRTLAGETATAITPGAVSRVEGSFLPPHRANLDILQRESAGPSATQQIDNSSLTELLPSGGGGRTGSATSLDGGAPVSPAASPSATSDRPEDDDSLNNDSALVPGPLNYEDDWSADSIDAARPPRLEFPTWATTTELAQTLQCVNQGSEVRRMLRDPLHVPFSDMDALLKDGPTKAALRRTVDAVRALLSLVLVVVTFIARFSYVFSILEFKLRELVCALAVSSNAASACGLHAFVPHSFVDEGMPARSAPNACTRMRRVERHRCLSNYLARSVADIVLGALFSALLAQYSFDVAEWLRGLAWWGIYDLQKSYLDWFHGWPAGLKLNDELNVVFGLLCRAVFALWKHALSSVDVDWMHLALSLWITVSLAGFSFAVAFVADVCNVVTLHLRNMRHILAIPYRVVLAVTSSLLLQFRGKRRNPLRNNRVDEWLFGADEMVLGMLIGTITAFAAPTVALYYMYFAAARTIIWVLQETLRGIAMTACYLPVYPVAVWLTARSRLPAGVSFERLAVRTSDVALGGSMSIPASPVTPLGPSTRPAASLTIVEVDLEPRPMVFGEAVAELLVVVRFVAESALNPSRIMRFVFTAHEKPIIDLRGSVFAHLIADPTRPELPGKNKSG